jgi:chromosome segregation ATPase
MAELAELEHRLAAALARISAGVELLAAPSDAPNDAPSAAQAEAIAHLQDALDAERTARVAADEALNDLQSPSSGSAPGADPAELDRLTRQLDAQGLDNQRLRSSVAQLREELRRLREAAEQGTIDAALVNRALQAELEALRAVRASEITEMADILATLGPLVDAEEARDHA